MNQSARNTPANDAWDAIKRFFSSKGMKITGKVLGVIAKILLTILLIAVITGCVFGVVLMVYVFNTFSQSQEIPDLTQIMDNGTSIIYTQTADGTWVENQRLEGINRIWTDYEEIPVYLKDAVVAIEDERFWEHEGVDWKRTAAAVLETVLGKGSFGGSTITQQLIKVVSGDNDSTIERKIREIFRALEMERDYYSKEQILEAYLNILPLSDGVVGVGAAANYYFAKDVRDLSLAECALIAGITNLPGYYDPYDYPDHAKQRQEIILGKMYELKMISADEYRQAYAEELYYENNARYVETQDYYVDLLIEDVIEDLMDTYGYSYTYAEQLVFFGGLRIYSYEDVDKQKAVQAVFEEDSLFPDIAGADEQPNACIFIMDYEGRVVATVGGRGKKDANRVQNRSTQSRRQPGSSIKPLAVYAPAMERNLINFSTIVRDAPIKLADGTLWPPNYGMPPMDLGWQTVQYAIQQSHNTVPVRILQEMGIDVGYDFLTQTLHFTSLEEADRDYAPLALGGFSYGVTAREMAAGYQIFGNGGYYNSPHTYHKVELDGQVLLEHIPEMEQAISPDTATIMNELLQRVVRNGTGYDISGRWPTISVFAKTGTTDGNRDSYFAGGTPYYVGALWMGYDSNREMTVNQGAVAKKIWSEAMEALHTDLPAASFPQWGPVEGHYYDPSSGVVTDSAATGKHGYYKIGQVPYNVNSLGGVSYGDKPTTTTTATTTVASSTTVTTTATATELTTTTVSEVTETSPPDDTTTLPPDETTEAPPVTTEPIPPEPTTTLPPAVIALDPAA